MNYFSLENIIILLFLSLNIMIYKQNKGFKENFTGISQPDLAKIERYEHDMINFINKNSKSNIEMKVNFPNNSFPEFNLPIKFNQNVTIKI